MNKKLLKIFGIILGVATIVLAIIVFSKSVGYSESNQSYGGDAYTGIQNAAAQAANNVKYVGEMLRFALGSQMLVMGLGMLLGSLCIRTKDAVKVEMPAPMPVQKPVSAPVQKPAAQQPFAYTGYKPPVTGAPAEWKCPRCGTVNEAEGRFCHVCGKAKV